MGNRLKNVVMNSAFAFLIIFIFVWVAFTYSILENDPQLPNTYIAIGTLLLAAATSILAGITWLAIRSSNEREKRDRKERLLKEIVDWAVNVKACGLGKVVRDIAPLTEKQRSVYFMALVSEQIGDFKIVLARGGFILKLSVKFFKGDLEKAVESLVAALDDHVELQEKLLKLVSKPITTQTFEDFTESVKDIVVIELKDGTDETADRIRTRHINELWEIAKNIVIGHKQEKVDQIVKKVIDEATKLIPE